MKKRSEILAVSSDKKLDQNDNSKHITIDENKNDDDEPYQLK